MFAKPVSDVCTKPGLSPLPHGPILSQLTGILPHSPKSRLQQSCRVPSFFELFFTEFRRPASKTPRARTQKIPIKQIPETSYDNQLHSPDETRIHSAFTRSKLLLFQYHAVKTLLKLGKPWQFYWISSAWLFSPRLQFRPVRRRIASSR
jgi:hypothetical protein